MQVLSQLRNHNEHPAPLHCRPEGRKEVPQPVRGTGGAFDIELSGDAAVTAFLKCPVAARGELVTQHATMIADTAGHHDHAFVLFESALLIHAFPSRGQPVHIFSKADPAVIKRRAVAAHAVDSRNSAAEVDGHKLIGTADWPVDRTARTQMSAACVHLYLLDDGPADGTHLAGGVGAARGGDAFG